MVEPRGQNSNPTALSALHVSTCANAIGHDNRRAGRSGINKEMVGPERGMTLNKINTLARCLFVELVDIVL